MFFHLPSDHLPLSLAIRFVFRPVSSPPMRSFSPVFLLLVLFPLLSFAHSGEENDKREEDPEDPCFRDRIWVDNLRYTAYRQYRNGWYARQQRIRLYETAIARTTPLPRLTTPFFEKGTTPDPKANYLSLTEVFSRPRTVDDDIGMPLLQPVNKQKTSFHRYYPYYNPYDPRNA